MRTHIVAIALAVLACGQVVHAQQARSTGGFHYRWVDASGVPHFSDSLTENAIESGYEVLDSQGMVVQHVGKPLSPAQRAAAAQRAVEQRDDAQRRRDDLQLLNTYPDVAAYKAFQQQMLDNQDQQIQTTRINLHSQEQALADLLARAASLENNKQPVPRFLSHDIAQQRDVVAGQRATLTQQQSVRAALLQQQARQLQHFIDLKAQEKAQRGY